MVASKLCEIIVVIIILFFYHFVFLQIDKENPKNKLTHKHEDELLLKKCICSMMAAAQQFKWSYPSAKLNVA